MKNLLKIILSSLTLTLLPACSSSENIFTQNYMYLSKNQVVEMMPFESLKNINKDYICISISNGRCRNYNSTQDALNDATLMSEKKWEIFGDEIKNLFSRGLKIIILEFDENDKVISQKYSSMYDF